MEEKAETTLNSTHLGFLPEKLPYPFPISGINKGLSINYYGTYEHLQASKLDDICTQILVNTPDNNHDEESHIALKTHLLLFLDRIRSDCKAPNDSCSFTVRMSKPMTDWKVPRWHQDARMYDRDDGSATIRHNYATTLLGPPTLFLDIKWTQEMLAYVEWHDKSDWTEAQKHHRSEKQRSKVDKFLQHKNFPIVAVEPGQIVRFSWGEDRSPIHSEPDMSGGDRIFVSSVLGSESELRSMCEIRDVAFEGSKS